MCVWINVYLIIQFSLSPSLSFSYIYTYTETHISYRTLSYIHTTDYVVGVHALERLLMTIVIQNHPGNKFKNKG